MASEISECISKWIVEVKTSVTSNVVLFTTILDFLLWHRLVVAVMMTRVGDNSTSFGTVTSPRRSPTKVWTVWVCEKSNLEGTESSSFLNHVVNQMFPKQCFTCMRRLPDGEVAAFRYWLSSWISTKCQTATPSTRDEMLHSSHCQRWLPI